MAEEKKALEEVKFTNVSVQFVESDKPHIILPKGMTYKHAHEWLTKIEAEENRTFNFEYKFKGWYPFDAMWALYRSLAEVFGFTHVEDFKHWWGSEPPTMITIDTGYNQKTQIPWGPLAVHGLSQALIPSIQLDQGLPCLQLNATIRFHERVLADKIMSYAEKVLTQNSVYRGKATEVDFTIFNPRDFRFDPSRAPKFWDTNVKEEDLILPRDVQDRINVDLWAPIKKMEVCIQHQIPLRRGILLAGPYGVGKTLAARVTAMLCEKHNWTFLYLRDPNQLKPALYFAKRYEPCVIFMEDLDRTVSGERTVDMDTIFNVVDGIDRKNDKVMIIFTTNNLEDIHRGMLRPGRIDSIIEVKPPDAEAAIRLVNFYGRGLIDSDADLTSVGEILCGHNPAIIRETVERSKLAAVLDSNPNEELKLKPHHLMVAAKQMLEHARLLSDPPPERPALEILGESMGRVIADGVRRAYGVDYDRQDPDSLFLKKAPEVLTEDIPKKNGEHADAK